MSGSHFVVATCRSHRHAATAAAGLAYAAQQYCKAAGLRQQPAVEGQSDSDWHVVDLGNTVVHLQLEDAREHYALEAKWQRLLDEQHWEQLAAQLGAQGARNIHTQHTRTEYEHTEQIETELTHTRITMSA